MSKDTTIKVEGVYKRFKLPHEKITSLKTLFTQGFKRKKGYEVQHALEDISLEVKKGEFFGIVGRNGSGKSTLLKMLAGIYQPTKGKISVNGKLVPFIELGVGFNPELTGRENVYLNGALLGFTKKEIDAQYNDIVKFAELERFMDQKLKNYSSGMQVRLAFSVATRAKADILLVDEVLAVGDADFQRKCYEYFKSLKKTDTTIVFVTHDMTAVREYCDRAILVEGGVITHQGDTDIVANEYLKLFSDKQSPLVINETDRWGTGEIVFQGIKHKVTDQNLVLDFDIVNQTDKDFNQGVEVGIDIYSDGNLVTGNNTRWADGYRDGISLGAKGRKHITLTFPNLLGNFDYTINMNVRTNNGMLNHEEIFNAIHISTPSPKYTKFYRALLPMTVAEVKKK